MKKVALKEGMPFWGERFSSILLSQYIWNLFW